MEKEAAAVSLLSYPRVSFIKMATVNYCPADWQNVDNATACCQPIEYALTCTTTREQTNSWFIRGKVRVLFKEFYYKQN